MTFPKQEIAFTSSTIYRLAQSVDEHLQDHELASRLRTLAVQVEGNPFISTSPGIPEMASLASGLNRFIGSLRHFGREKHDMRVASDLRSILQETENALAIPFRRIGANSVMGLYVIVDSEKTSGRSVSDIARFALNGGASVIQYRDKINSIGDQLRIAHELRDICEEFNASFIVNDSAGLATASGSHGLHLGQGDLPIYEARRILYSSQFIGTSNVRIDQLEQSVSENADYLVVGAIFDSNLTVHAGLAGLETLRKANELQYQIPILANGGINLENIDSVLEVGADGICVMSAVSLSENPERSARVLVDRIAAYRKT